MFFTGASAAMNITTSLFLIFDAKTFPAFSFFKFNFERPNNKTLILLFLRAFCKLLEIIPLVPNITTLLGFVLL